MIEYKLLKKSKNPKVLVVTPLSLDDSIMRETRIALQRNVTQYDWVSFKSDANLSSCCNTAIMRYTLEVGNLDSIPDYILRLDADVIPDRYMIDKMYKAIKKLQYPIGYVYCSFRVLGTDKVFDAPDFDMLELFNSNYISACSMIKKEALNKVGYFFSEDRYDGLLDWCLWLKMMEKGIIGRKCDTAFYSVIPSNKSIDRDTFSNKVKMVVEEISNPIKQTLISAINSTRIGVNTDADHIDLNDHSR